MEGAITYNELGILILFLVLLVVGVYAALALKNLNMLLKKTNSLLGANEGHINRILANAAEISEQGAFISQSVAANLDEAGKAIEAITNSTADTVMKFNETADQIRSYAVPTAELVKALIDIFRSERRAC
jgi:predicted PurR-regulated permease PerM